MRAVARMGKSLALLLATGLCTPGQAQAQVLLGRPEPIVSSSAAEVLPATAARLVRVESSPARPQMDRPQPLVRAQAPDVPPPPPPVSPFGAAGPAPTVAPLGAKGEGYACGVVNDNADVGGFWGRVGRPFRRCYEDVSGTVGGMFQPSGTRRAFQSDHAFDLFSSPVSNPFYFEDPRALTELRPIFIWQHTPGSNYIYAGGDNFFAGLQARVALNERLSLVIHKLGWIWSDPVNPTGVPGFATHSGLSELHLGPKITICRNDITNTVAAIGMQFEVPIGPGKVFQNTGNLSLTPYFSIAQAFGKSQYGNFNIMNTTGYSLGVDSQRTDFVYSSIHLDYNVLGQNRLFPMIELNWAHYTFNGSARDIGFEGRDMFNFGSAGTAGHDELTLALGGRVKITDHWQLGLAGEFSLLGGGRHMDNFRLTADMIFRY